MTWLKGLLVAIGLVVVLVVAIVAVLGGLGSNKTKEVRHISIGQKTITVSHYKDLTQETTAEGVKIVVDGHTITATADAISVDGKPQNFDPTQDIEIAVDETGAVQAKAVGPEAPAPNADTADQGADQGAPAQ